MRSICVGIGRDPCRVEGGLWRESANRCWQGGTPVIVQPVAELDPTLVYTRASLCIRIPFGVWLVFRGVRFGTV